MTTPENNETLDTFSDTGLWIGTASRADVHRLGLWHQTFHAWIVTETYGQPYVWFQRRSMKKQQYPGMWDITVAGHLLSGEQPVDGLREIEEELGIRPSVEAQYLSMVRDEIVTETCIDREMCHVFKIHEDLRGKTSHINQDEVQDLAFVPLAEAIAWADGKIPHLMLQKESQDALIRLDFREMVPHTTVYYRQTLGMLRM
jgi:isopentenyldiphosphate isomerase